MEEALRRIWESLLGRWEGPMNFRLIIQPTVATIFAIRSGLRDARNGKPPFLWTVLTSPDDRRALLRQGWKDVGKVFVLALILDVIYQLVEHSSLQPLQALAAATILAIIPYALIRGFVTRVARRFIGDRGQPPK